MTRITASMAQLLVGRLDRSVTRRSKVDDEYADLVSEVSPTMIRDLAIRGLWAALQFIYQIVSLWIVSDFILFHISGEAHWSSLQSIAFGTVILIAVVLVFEKYFIQMPLERELSYRRKQGKWRWDH